MTDNPSTRQFAFAGSTLDRQSARRTDATYMQALRASPAARCVHIQGDQVEMQGETLLLAPPANEAVEIFLGVDPAGTPWFAGPATSRENLLPLRAIMLEGHLPRHLLSMLAQARSLVHWHETHGFCAKCGAPTQLADQGYRRHCNACGADHFPRTDPVVIMAIRREDSLLLGRQASWSEGMYSTLAGFMEPGETMEEAVRREVMEEAGIPVGKVTYVASQPWPFPSSLMIGAIGEALADAITIDSAELQDARWFSRDELRQMLDRTHPQGFYASHPYAIAHHLIRAVLAG